MFLSACTVVTVMTNGCVNNNVRCFDVFIWRYFTQAHPYLRSPFLSDKFYGLELPQYL